MNVVRWHVVSDFDLGLPSKDFLATQSGKDSVTTFGLDLRDIG